MTRFQPLEFTNTPPLQAIPFAYNWMQSRMAVNMTSFNYLCPRRAGGSTHCQWPYVLTTENPSQKVYMSFYTIVPLADHDTPPYFKEPSSIYASPQLDTGSGATLLFILLRESK